MEDYRDQLPKGTRIRMESGGLYEITGSVIGFGGGSIIYPAIRLIQQNGTLVSDGFSYVVKECYPASLDFTYQRSVSGEIVPRDGGRDGAFYLHRAQQLQLSEGEKSRAVFQTASRMLPTLESCSEIRLALPGKEEVPVRNTVSIMASLSGKGQSVSQCLREHRRFAPAQAFRIIQQLLFSLDEIHRANYLHLDIQPGNLFLRGTLEEKSELLTLIDFGSAREMEHGKTAPIADCVIFTSRGFSAPEMLLHNDGSLELGPEADLYSTGCLALYLLTGRRAAPGMLLTNSSGRYLKANEIRRMKCPRHLVTRIQEILAKALEKEPENRYHTAAEMLADVTDLVDALQPYRTDLSAVKYDAFVCYKHGPVDSAAAISLQRQLEQFRGPWDVTQKRRPFERVFVDEGELSSCADFGQQIREALKNSGWLIVICSPDTPTSPWVELEIETFLEYHDSSRILAVLTGGDPSVSFPARLLGTDGAGQVLAADARGDCAEEVIKKLRGDALLRIAAPMMGTTFDTLKQRQKVYLMQRVAAVTGGFLVLAALFAGYAMNRARVIADQADQIADQADRIQAEYQTALENESRFLTEQAKKRLADNDPLGAMELLLEALPSREQQDRPVLTETKRTLGDALGIYKTPEKAEYTATAVGIIDTDSDYFCIDDTGAYLFTWDSTDPGVQVWDTGTLSLVQTLVPESHISYSRKPLPLVRENGVVLNLYEYLLCVDYVTGETKWTWKAEQLKNSYVSQDQTKLVVFSGEIGDSFRMDEEDPSPHALAVDILDAATGEVLTHIPFAIDADQYVETNNAVISPDLKWAVIPTIESGSADLFEEFNNLYLLNLETGACSPLLRSRTNVSAKLFSGDCLAVMRYSGFTLTTTLGGSVARYAKPITVFLETYDLNTGKPLWSVSRQLYSTQGTMDRIMEAPYDTGEITGQGLLYVFDECCMLLDKATGAVVRDDKLHNGAVDIRSRENGYETINVDGSSSLGFYDIETLLHILYMDGPVSEARLLGDSIFVRSKGDFEKESRIWKYQMDRADQSYRQICQDDNGNWEIYKSVNTPGGSRVILIDREKKLVGMLDTASGKLTSHEIPEEYEFTGYAIQGVSEDGTKLFWENSRPGKLYFVLDVLSGEITEIDQPQLPEEHSQALDYLWQDGQILYTAGVSIYEEDQYQGRDIVAYAWDCQDGTSRELARYRLPQAPADAEKLVSYNIRSLTLDETGEHLLFTTTANAEYYPEALVCMHMETGEVQEISIGFDPVTEQTDFSFWRMGPWLMDREGTRAVFAFDKAVYIVSTGGELLDTIVGDEPTVGLRFTPDGSSLLLLSRSGVISQYRFDDGTLLGKISLGDYTTGYVGLLQNQVNWEFIDESSLMVFLSHSHDGFVVDISGESPVMDAVLESCVAYDAAGNNFLLSNADKKTTIGSFRRYTLEDMIQMAQKALGK